MSVVGPLRAMTAADMPAVLDVQEPAAVAGLADVFPQDTHPLPRDRVAERWLEELLRHQVRVASR